MEKLSEEQEEKVAAILKKRSKFVWKQLNINHTIMMLNNIREGNIKLTDFLAGGIMTYRDYLYERDLLEFVE